jgi:hypothetical protein
MADDPIPLKRSYGPSRHGADCSCTRCRGFQPGHTLSLRHGARSERHIRPLAGRYRRRLLRAVGIRARELDGIGRALLDNWARAQAKVDLLDRYFAEHGLLDAEGAPVAATKIYFTALNTAQRALVRLREHLRERGKETPLDAYLDAAYREIGDA